MGQREHASTPINLEMLRLIREGFAASGMTQEALARTSEVPRSTLANILSPTAAPRLIHVGQMVQIAVALGADARAWIGELEAFERKRLGKLGPRRARPRPAPQVQKRAARAKPAGKE